MKSTYNQTLIFLVIVCSIVLFASRNEASLISTAPVVVHAEAVQKPVTRQVTTPAQGAYEYIEITSSCGPQFEGMCIPAYAGPGTEYEEVTDLRNGMILKIKNRVTVNGQTWYRVYFDEWLRYADRVEGDWYVPAVAGRVVKSDGEQILDNQQVTTTKRIVIDLSDHMIYAYDGNYLYLTTKVSTGIDSTPTPLGTFSVYKKTPSRYMQGPLPGVSDVPFDLPGVPWNLYFTLDGAVIHGSYWHDRYGTDQSNGCINLPPEIAKILYDWAPLGTPVIVQR
jgi:hypothetical protein